MGAFYEWVSPAHRRTWTALAGPLLSLATVAAPEAAATPARLDRCVDIPRDADPAPVTVCETKSEYVFTVVGERTAYAKDDFRAALRTAIFRWYDDAGVEAPSLARLEFWVAVPEANPAGAMARVAVVDGVTSSGDPAPSVVFFLGLDPATWTITDADVGVLDDERYPEAYGHRAGILLVKRAQTADKGQVEAFLARYGVGAGDEFAPSWSAHPVTPLTETETAALVRDDPGAKALVDKVELNQIVEWIARRERAFAFSLGEP
jgi:hypothetical protein